MVGQGGNQGKPLAGQGGEQGNTLFGQGGEIGWVVAMYLMKLQNQKNAPETDMDMRKTFKSSRKHTDGVGVPACAEIVLIGSPVSNFM